MKPYIFIIAILCVVAFIACGGKELSGDGRANSNSIENGQKVNVTVNAEAVNVPGNGNIMMPGKREMVNSPGDPNFKPKPMEYPAAFNSTMATTMRKDGKFIETRTFKDDPQISKLERMQELKTFKLFLKSGKMIDLPYEKAETLFVTGAPADILHAAGIKPASTPVSRNPGKTEQMKKQ